MTLLSRFQEELKTNKLITKSDRILVAFSGGKDSVCLLFLLHSIREHFGFDLGACHIHHGIRDKEADSDLAFCKNFCEEKGIPFFFEKVNAPAFCKENGYGIEEGARLLRYDALQRVAASENYNKIATAHSASDQGETILLHLIRGSGFNGASGIPIKRNNLIRPLLPFYKSEILSFLKEEQLNYCDDSTNFDSAYARNRMRNKILPELEMINPAAEKALVRFGSIAKEQADLVSYLCDHWEKEQHINCRSASLPLKPLHELISQSQMMPVFKEALSRMAKNEKIVIDFYHFNELYSLLKNPVEGKIIEISKGFSFVIENGQLIFKKNVYEKRSINYQVKIQVGCNPLPLSQTVLEVSDKRSGKVVNVNKKLLIIHLAYDKIKGDLFVRNRKVGDCIQIDGMTKSLKKLLQEAKLPAIYRNDLPLLCDDEGILWIPYVGLCDRVRNSNNNEIFTVQLKSNYFPKQTYN